MWRCKECSLSFSTRYDLLKHLILHHRHRQLHSCPYQNCPCNFKTQNALRIHLSRVHPKQTQSQELLELKTFCCPLCNCSNISTERDFFTHIDINFKSHETVTCMFGDCTFKHQLMISYQMRASSFEKPVLELTNVSTVPIDVLKTDIVENIEQRFPGTREVHMTRSVSTKGVTFKNDMIIAHGSTNGLPHFGQIVHVLLFRRDCFLWLRDFVDGIVSITGLLSSRHVQPKTQI